MSSVLKEIFEIWRMNNNETKQIVRIYTLKTVFYWLDFYYLSMNRRYGTFLRNFRQLSDVQLTLKFALLLIPNK